MIRIRPAIEMARRIHLEQKRDDGSYYLVEHVYPLAYETMAYLYSTW